MWLRYHGADQINANSVINEMYCGVYCCWLYKLDEGHIFMTLACFGFFWLYFFLKLKQGPYQTLSPWGMSPFSEYVST